MLFQSAFLMQGRSHLIGGGVHAEDEQLDGNEGLQYNNDCVQDDGSSCVPEACKAISCQGPAQGV